MAVVGTAYVAIRAVTDKLRSDIEQSLQGSSDAARRAGEGAGKNYSEGFNESSGDNVGPDLAHLADSAGDAGRKAGDNFSNSMRNSASRVKVLDDSSFDPALDAARNAGKDIEDELVDSVRKAGNAAEGEAGDGGRKIGQGFSRGFSGSGASSAIGAIGARLLALVPIIAILVGSISALVGGLFAIASAAAPAAGGLAVLPGLALAAASAFAVLKVSFGGIGKALSAGLKEQSGAVGTAANNSRALAAAARAVENAQRGIGDAARQNADALSAANRAIADAQRNLNNTMQDTAARSERSDRSLFLAQRNLRDALDKQTESQVKLTTARKDARDEILALQFALEDSTLGQERAAINLEKARRQLQLMSGLPPDNLLRKEAELSYKEAELNVRKTAEQFRKSTDAADQAQKNGVDNAKQVVDARKTEADSAEKVADAQYNLLQASKDKAKTERENAEQIMLAQRALTDAVQKRDRTLQDNARRTADAQRALQDALENSANAAIKASPAMSAFGRAMDGLAPAQRRFVTYLLSIKDQWKGLKETMAENVLGPVQSALEEFMRGGLFDTLSKGMDGASKSVGRFFTSLEDIFKTKTFKGEFKKVMDSNVKVMDDLGDAVSNIIRLFFSVAAAAAPMTERFSEWVKTVTGGWADKAGGNSKKMEAFFKKAGDTAAQLGRIIGDIVVGIGKLGKAATPAGQTLLDSFEKNTEKFRHWLDDPKKFDAVKKNFDDIATNVQKIGDLAVDVGKAFGGLGSDKGIGDLADTLRTRVLPGITDLFHTLNNDAAPAIGEFIGSITDMFKALSESPALEIFLGTISTLADAITAFAKNPAGQAFLVFIGTLVGVMKSVQLVRKVLFIDNIVSGLGKIDKFIKGDFAKKLSGVFSKAGDAAEGAAPKLKKATDALDGDGKKGKTSKNTPDGVDRKTAKASDGFKNNLSDLARQFAITGEAKDAFILNLKKLQGQFALMSGGTVAKGAGAGAAASVAGVGAAGKDAAKLEGAAEKAAKSGGKLSKVFGGLKGVAGGLSAALFGVSGATLAALWPLLLIVGAVAGIILLFKGAWDHSEKLRKAWDEKLKPAFDKLGKALKPLIDAFKEFVGDALKKFGDFLADKVIPAVAEFVTFIAEHLPGVIDKFKDVFGWIKKNWPLILGILTGPIGFAVVEIIRHWDDIKAAAVAAKDWIVDKFTAVVDFFKNLPGAIADAAVGLWDSITGGLDAVGDKINGWITKVVDWVAALPGRVAAGAVGLWNGIVAGLKAMAEKIAQRFNDFIALVVSLPGRVARGAARIWHGITDGLGALGDLIRRKFDTVIGWVADLPSRVGRGARRIWNGITDGLGDLGRYVSRKFGDLVGWVGGLGSRIGRAARGMWDGIKEAFRDSINWMISKWNGLSFSIPSIDTHIKGIGRVGGFTLSTPNLPYLAQGGVVPATPGGRLAVLAEAGQDERVQPLGPNGLSKGEEMMMEILAAMRDRPNQPVQVIVNPPPGTDVHTLARLVSIELGFQMGR